MYRFIFFILYDLTNLLLLCISPRFLFANGRGVYESQVEESLDIRVTDTDAESFKLKSVLQVLKTHETEKKRKYKKACIERRWHFKPFVCSVDGALGKEAVGFLKRLAHKLAIKWHFSYSVVMGFVRARLSLAILRATALCIRGSRKSCGRNSVCTG
jgi:hypothetical protein